MDAPSNLILRNLRLDKTREKRKQRGKEKKPNGTLKHKERERRRRELNGIKLMSRLRIQASSQ